MLPYRHWCALVTGRVDLSHRDFPETMYSYVDRLSQVAPAYENLEPTKYTTH